MAWRVKWARDAARCVARGAMRCEASAVARAPAVPPEAPQAGHLERFPGIQNVVAARFPARGFASASIATDSGAGSSAADAQDVLAPLPREQRRALGFPKTRRCGAVAVKCGMTQEWDANGVRVPLTVLWLDDCKVIQVKSRAKDGYLALQVGSGSRKRKRTNKAQRGHFARHLSAQSPISRHVAEFRVTEESVMGPGAEILASHFVPGQYVDVAGVTKGKGFQGVMKRHGFRGGTASHGNSKAHRTLGSSGQCQDPGRVFKGKKMPGQMGAKRRSAQNLLVYKVDPTHNLLWVKGSVPGNRGSFVHVKDAVLTFQDVPLPLPTCARGGERNPRGVGVGPGQVEVAPASTKYDPFTRFWQ